MQTRASLLERLRDPQDSRAWDEFVSLYAPLLHAYAMRNHLQDADAADVAQETLRHVLRAAPRFIYDPAKGSFRGWLLTIARNEIRKHAHRLNAPGRGTGDTEILAVLNEQPAPVDDPVFETDYRNAILRKAAERARESFRDATWQMFWRTAVLNEPVDSVSAAMGVSPGAVYIARSRVVARVRAEAKFLAGEES
jgi:RNA polymerase sigma-70 factor (ECF subfamily)